MVPRRHVRRGALRLPRGAVRGRCAAVSENRHDRVSLHSRGRSGGRSPGESFRQGLQDLGYVEGKTIAIVYRSAEGKPERLPALAAELVQLPGGRALRTVRPGGRGSQSHDHDDPNRHGVRRRSRRHRPRRQPRPPGRKHHRAIPDERRVGRETATAAEGGEWQPGACGGAVECARCGHDQHLQRDSDCGAAAGYDRATARGARGQRYRRRHRRDDGGTSRRALHDHGCVDQQVCATGLGFRGAAPAPDECSKASEA